MFFATLEGLPLRIGWSYRERGTHANNLNILLKKQQLGDHQLKKIPPMFIVEHVQLIKNHHAEIPDATFLDGGVD